MDNLESALRDQAENPGSCKVFPRSRGALEWILATPRRKDASVRKKSARSQDRASANGLGLKSLVDILSPSFGDANVATQPNQSNRRDRGRKGKDKPHRSRMPRTLCGTKRS
jgi:hypothetical protein